MQTYTLLAVVMNLGPAEISLVSPRETLVSRKRDSETTWPQLVRLDHRSEAEVESLVLPTWDKDVIRSLGLKEGEVVSITITRG